MVSYAQDSRGVTNIMAMGIVSDLEFNIEKSKLVIECDDLTVKQTESGGTIVDINPGRGKDNFQVPDALRKIIGEESEINGRESGLDLANHFGISPSSVSAYSHGSTSTKSYDSPNNELRNHINDAKERISKKARNRLVLALNSLTSDKFESAKAKDLSSVAKDMSVVIKNMEPDIPRDVERSSSPTFVFYAPQFKKEESFDVLYSKE